MSKKSRNSFSYFEKKKYNRKEDYWTISTSKIADHFQTLKRPSSVLKESHLLLWPFDETFDTRIKSGNAPTPNSSQGVAASVIPGYLFFLFDYPRASVSGTTSGGYAVGVRRFTQGGSKESGWSCTGEMYHESKGELIADVLLFL